MYCKYCQENKDENEFEVANIIKGKRYLRLKCKSCRLIDERSYQLSKRNWLREYKSKQTCTHCGSIDYRTFEFHHISNDKEANISSKIYSWSIKRIEKEIAKCIVLCANCHRIEHYK